MTAERFLQLALSEVDEPPMRRLDLPRLAAALLVGSCATTELPRAAVVHNAAGARLLVDGRLDDAEARFRLALEYHPRFADAHANLGVVALHRGDAEAAEAHLRQAVRLNEDFALAYGNLGVALERRGRRLEAQKAYEAALGVDPGLVDARMDLARLLVRSGRFAEARAHLMRLIQIDPASANAHALLAYADLRLGRPRAAEARVERLLASAPDSAVGRLVRGILRGLQGALEEAAEDLGAALDDPLLGEAARLRLCAIRVEQRRYAEAERLLAPLLASRPRDPAVALVARTLESHRARSRSPALGSRAVRRPRTGARPAGRGR